MSDESPLTLKRIRQLRAACDPRVNLAVDSRLSVLSMGIRETLREIERLNTILGAVEAAVYHRDEQAGAVYLTPLETQEITGVRVREALQKWHG
jgi:hypothetical protein